MLARVRPYLTALGAVTLLAAGPTPFDLRVPIGKPLPAMTLVTLEGAAIETGALRGRPTLLVLLASWCEPCRSALPNLRADLARYGDRVRFIGIDVYEDRAAAAAFLARERLPFPVAVFTRDELDAAVPLEVRNRLGDRYEIPADVLAGADGIVRATWSGTYYTHDGAVRDPLPAALAKLGIE